MTGVWLMLGSAGLVSAEEGQPTPAQGPTAFETRNTGDAEEGEVSIDRNEGKPRKITYTAVTDSREWKDAKGKVIRARLLAFEAAEGEVAGLVRDGQVRLLVDGAKRFSLLPLEKLSPEDRAFITGLAAARQKAGPPGTAEARKP
jgi:hypothetical protein